MYQIQALAHSQPTSSGPKAREGFIAAPVKRPRHQHIERDREADRKPGDRLERPARIGGGREDDPDEEEGEQGFDDEAGAEGDAVVQERRSELRRIQRSPRDRST